MIILFNTVRRKRPVREGGELIQLDWNRKQILKTLPLYPARPEIKKDPNPRGNTRGGKGILIKENRSWVGTYHTILFFNRNLNAAGSITNFLFANIHEMCFSGENMWVSATAIDCAVLVDQKGKTLDTWWPREDPLLQKEFGLTPLPIDKSADNRIRFMHAEMGQKPGHTHLNSITGWYNEYYALLNRQGVLVRFRPRTDIILLHPALKGAHSPRLIENGRTLAVCSSFRHEILFFDMHSGRLTNVINLLDFEPVINIQANNPDQPFNKSIFVRGLDVLDSERILTGIAPATILEINMKKNKLINYFQYSREVGDAIHGLVHYEY